VQVRKHMLRSSDMIGNLLKPMDEKLLLNELLDLAERIGIEVRQDYLGGEGGGICQLRGQKVLFLDMAATLADQLDQTAEALAEIEGVKDQYLLPKVRQLLESYWDEE
jgi:hypothetical protein